MYRLTLPFTDHDLQLTPRWAEWAFVGQLTLLLCCILPVALVLWLYRYELRLVSRAVASLLLVLRLVVIAFLLLVVTLKPVAARPVVDEVQGRVLVAVDRSGSMEIADPQRSAVNKLRLARAFHWGRGICSDLQIDEWIDQYAKQGAPRWLGESEFPDDAERRRKLAEERKRQHDLVIERIDALTRTQIEKLILEDGGSRLLAALGERYRVELLGFHRDAWDVPLDRRDELFSAADKASDASATDLLPPISRALERTGAEQGKLRGVILITDGRQTTPDADGLMERVAQLRRQGVPIFPVAMGDPTAPPDVVVASIKSPELVFKEKDIDVPVEATIRVNGPIDREIVVELQRPGEPPLERRLRVGDKDDSVPRVVVQANPKNGSQLFKVIFQPQFTKEGTQQVKVAVRAQPKETSTENNSRTAYVKVVDDRAKVLLVDGEPRWEYHYLATALARDKQVKLDRVVFNQPRINRIPEEELERIGNPARQLPVGPDALLGYDIIILGDVSPEQLPPAERERLEKYVAERGGSLVIVAGKQHMPLAYRETNRQANEQSDPILKMLPIEEPRAVQSKKGFPLTLTADGRSSPFLLIEDSPDESEQRWQEFPPHFWAVVGRAKPGARPSLAYYPGESPTLDPKERAEQEKEQALIVQQGYGRGQVLFVGLDSTWRWRYKTGDKYHHRFWGQLVRWASSDKLLEGGNRFVRFGAGKPMYAPGQEIDVMVRLGEDVKLAAGAPARARLLRIVGDKEEPTALVPLAPREGNARILDGRVKDLPPGEYRVDLDIPDLADKLRGPKEPAKDSFSQARFQVSPPDNVELAELATDRALLDALAAESQGQVYTPDQIAQLIARLTQEAAPRSRQVENELWTWWPLLVLLMGLLTVEWVGRKWAGLP